MENVPQVLTSPLWPDLLGRLEAMGYRNRWAKLDSSRFGSAQKRVRAFMVSRLGAEPPELPTEDYGAPALCLRDVMEPERDENYINRIPLERILWRKEDGNNGQIKVVADMDRPNRLECQNRLYSSSAFSPALLTHGGGGREIKVVADDKSIDYEWRARIYSKDGSAPAITDLGRHGRDFAKIIDSESGEDLIVSILTPRECWRLMGFPEWAYLRASRVSSETQLYNQAGNSIVVEVLEAIFRTMFSDRRVRRQTSLMEFMEALS